MQIKSLLFYGGCVVLSVVLTIGIPLIALLFGDYHGGYPLPWSSFSLLGSTTDEWAFFIDVCFWFVVVFLIFKVGKLIKK